MFSLLCLYYNVDLLNICERSGTFTNVFEFINDINIIDIRHQHKRNIKTLKQLHYFYENGRVTIISHSHSKKHGFIHLTCNLKKIQYKNVDHDKQRNIIFKNEYLNIRCANRH